MSWYLLVLVGIIYLVAFTNSIYWFNWDKFSYKVLNVLFIITAPISLVLLSIFMLKDHATVLWRIRTRDLISKFDKSKLKEVEQKED